MTVRMTDSTTDHDFRISSFCGGGGCVAVAVGAAAVHLRDSKIGDTGPVLSFTPDEWDAFLQGVRAGEFELPPRGTA